MGILSAERTKGKFKISRSFLVYNLYRGQDQYVLRYVMVSVVDKIIQRKKENAY